MGVDNPHYHEQGAYIFTHNVNLAEGVKQALWLTKSALVGDGKVWMRQAAGVYIKEGLVKWIYIKLGDFLPFPT